MDLNAPAPSEDEDDQHQELDQQQRPDQHQESALEIARREREERKLKMKRLRGEEENNSRAAKVARPSAAIPTYTSSDRLRAAGPLPQGWVDCPAAGEPIEGLIPSKVPLSDSFNELLDPGMRYSKSHVIRKQRAVGREIGMVIDLTNTSRYYNPEEWRRIGVKHVKIACRGRDEVPDPESVNTFVFEVFRYFCQKTAKNVTSKSVLVHCTHGHNRTGFMIVHFLVRTRNFSVEQAIQAFANVRPPGIYKQEYIESLFNFYHERRPESIVCPHTPEWKREDVDLNGEAKVELDDDGEDDGGIMAALQEATQEPPGEMTNDDVLGDAIPEENQLELQKICCWGLGVKTGGHGPPRFPGSQPVSLDRKNLQLLRQRYYYATWKADGTRYMLLIVKQGCYLIDRNFTFRRVQLRFPLKGSPDTQHGTLLDGEMVIDKNPETGGQERRYLVYDIMMLNQQHLSKIPFFKRWKQIEEDVIKPRALDRSSNTRYKYESELFRVRRKNFWMLSTVKKLLENFIPTLSHEADGLIFQDWEDEYVPRTHEGLLKWKYAHMNSVDFLFKISASGAQLLFLVEKGGKYKQLDGARVTFPDTVDPAECNGKIVECALNKEEHTWQYMRIRYDKEMPNAYHVYQKVMGSIADNITEEVLLNEITEILKLPMYAERIREETARQQQWAHQQHQQGRRA